MLPGSLAHFDALSGKQHQRRDFILRIHGGRTAIYWEWQNQICVSTRRGGRMGWQWTIRSGPSQCTLPPIPSRATKRELLFGVTILLPLFRQTHNPLRIVCHSSFNILIMSHATTHCIHVYDFATVRFLGSLSLALEARPTSTISLIYYIYY